MQKCRVNEADVHGALLSGDQQDQLVIAYNLIMDNKRIADETEKLQILDFFVASSPPVESFMMVGCLGDGVMFVLVKEGDEQCIGNYMTRICY